MMRQPKYVWVSVTEAAARLEAIGEGVVVPVEATRDMLVALMGNPLLLAANDEVIGREAYRAMLAARPGAG